jgi:dihydroflavonol-4-reductase
MNDVDTFAPELAGCDVLFHTAAYFREAFSAQGDHWPALERVNIIGTLRLFELARRHGVGKIIHTSSNATIAKRPNGQPSDENDLLPAEQALTPYARSKVLGDKAIADFAKEHRFPVVTVLPAWMFGPGDAAPTSSGKFVLDFMNRRIPGTFDSGFDIVDARDVARAMIAAVMKGRGGERYIVSAAHVSLAGLCRALEQVTGIPAPKRSIPKALMYTVAWVSQQMASLAKGETNLTVDSLRVLTHKLRTDSGKAKKELEITFRPIEETLRDTAEWLRANRSNFPAATR